MPSPLVTILAVALASAPSRTWAQDPSAGRFTVAGDTVTYAKPLGLFDAARRRISMIFTATPLAAEDEAAARAAGVWDGAGAGKTVVVDIDLAANYTSGMLGDVVSCRVRATGFKTPLVIEGNAKTCHLVSTGGMLRAGGMFIGLLEGEGANYSFRLPFTVTFPAATATTAAAAPLAGAPPAAPAIPANSVKGEATYTGQTLRQSHGLAWWQAAESRVSIALFDHAPPAGILADVKAGSWGDGGPNLLVSFGLPPGPGQVAGVTYCYVNPTFARGGSLAANANAVGCGLTELGGDIRAGGTVSARLKGSARGPNGPYTWDLTLHLPIAP